MKNKKYQHTILLIFVVCTILSFSMAIHIINTRVANKKNNAKYAAESTTARIKAEINSYVVILDMLENYLMKYGEKELLENFEHLSETVLDDDGVIKCVELAKVGEVSNIYPFEGNEEALGLNLLKDKKRKIEAKKAISTGEVTMAGPFKLRQSDEGVLLLNPIYTYDKQKNVKFWGFSLLVIDWNTFIKKINLRQLDDNGYLYKIWRRDPSFNKKYVLAQSEKKVRKGAIEVLCTVPNDIWYVDISLKQSWYMVDSLFQQVMIAIIIPILGCVGIWLYVRNKQQENIYKVELEAARNKAEHASDAKTRFLRSMSHDIRTPMNAVLGFTKIAHENLNDIDIVKESLRKIEISGKHLLDLINDVLNVSRIESGIVKSTFVRQDIYEFGDDLIAIFEQGMKEKNIDFKVNYFMTENMVSCDAHHLREICVNLISNAMKFTTKGGSVICNFRQMDAVEDLKCPFQIEIIDTGIGMSSEFQKVQYQLFEREHTEEVSKTEGTGLGLPIVKRLVDMLDGSIECISELGKGTTYKINFIFEIINENDKLESSKVKKELIQGKKILLVEDVELNKEIAEYVLKNMGFDVEHAVDGKEAVDKITYASSNYYDIVLMDIQMPNMNGYDATKAIRKLEDLKKASVPIYAMTANAFEEDKKCALEAGMNGHFSKPLDVDKIYSVLCRV